MKKKPTTRKRSQPSSPTADRLTLSPLVPPVLDPSQTIESAFRGFLAQMILRAGYPYVAALNAVFDAGDVRWDERPESIARHANEPVPDEIQQKVPPLREVLKDELSRLDINEDNVQHWLAKGHEFGQILDEARRRGKSPFEPLERIWEQELNVATKLLPGGAWLTPQTRKVLETDIQRLEEVGLPALRRVNRLINRGFRAVVFGKGRPRVVEIRVAARGLTRLIKARTGHPQSGLVAALIKDAGLLPKIECWRESPLASPSQQQKLWCQRAKKGRRACSRDPLRCAMATEQVGALLKPRSKRKGTEATS